MSSYSQLILLPHSLAITNLLSISIVVESLRLCLTLLQPRGLRPTRLLLHGISQARTLEWVAIFFLQGIFPTKGFNQGIIYYWATGKILCLLDLPILDIYFLINWIIENVVFHDWLLHFVYKFFCEHMFPVLLDIYPRSGISGSYIDFMFNFLRYCQILFQHGCITLHSHQEYMRLLISQNPYQQLLLSPFFDYSSPSGCEVVTCCGFGLHLTDF